MSPKSVQRFCDCDMHKQQYKARRLATRFGGRHYKSGFATGEPAREKIIPEQQDAAIS
jgi:hypothetical protein